MIDNSFLKKVAIDSAKAVSGALVGNVSNVLKEGMVERDMGEDKIEALDTVTEVCKDMVPDMADKALTDLFNEDEQKVIE